MDHFLLAEAMHLSQWESSVERCRCPGFILGDPDSTGLEWGWKSVFQATAVTILFDV